MKIFLIILIVIVAIVVLYLAVSLAFALIVNKFMFGVRYDKNPLLKYYSAEDFGLNAEPVETVVKNMVIRGYLYTNSDIESCDKLIIFAHGMGPGQCAYTTEIAFFCKNGFAVLAFDDIGCNLSGGKCVRGMETGTICTVAAIQFANKDSRLSGKKKILAGHSMGAYSLLCATLFEKVDGAVAMSAPECSSEVLDFQAKLVLGKVGRLIALVPFFKLISRIKHGKYAEIKASQAIQKSGVKALIIQGDKDAVVSLASSAYAHSDGENITKLLCEGKRHNPYNTINAETELANLQKGLADSKKMTEEERDKFFSSLDYAAICEEDPEVMNAILDFIKSL